MPDPILLSTLGSHGDLYPVLAVARALEARGQLVHLALSPEDAEVAQGIGLNASAVGPTEAEFLAGLGLDADQMAQQFFDDPRPILDDAVLPALAEAARTLAPMAQKARAVASSFLAQGAPLAAEMTGRPHVPLFLQPLHMRSALDPPRIPGFVPPMAAQPGNALTRGWNRLWQRIVDIEYRRRHGSQLNRVRRDLGLPHSRHTPFFAQAIAPALRLGLWDPAFAPKPADAPPDLTLTGFPVPPVAAPLPDGLVAFLDAGAPPLVVSLGSFAHGLAGTDFYHRAAGLARRAGLRAVLVAGDRPTPAGHDVFTVARADHRALFPRAACVLHHGGIGTTAAALAAGRPQLVLPLGADQPDQAARIEEMGLGRRIARPETADMALAAALSDEVAARARIFATRLISDGAPVAAEALITALYPAHA